MITFVMTTSKSYIFNAKILGLKQKFWIIVLELHFHFRRSSPLLDVLNKFFSFRQQRSLVLLAPDFELAQLTLSGKMVGIKNNRNK